MGDYNIDYNDMRVTRRLKVREFEKRFGLRQIINEDTRVTSTSSTKIDLIFTDVSHITLNHAR